MRLVTCTQANWWPNIAVIGQSKLSRILRFSLIVRGVRLNININIFLLISIFFQNTPRLTRSKMGNRLFPKRSLDDPYWREWKMSKTGRLTTQLCFNVLKIFHCLDKKASWTYEKRIKCQHENTNWTQTKNTTCRKDKEG